MATTSNLFKSLFVLHLKHQLVTFVPRPPRSIIYMYMYPCWVVQTQCCGYFLLPLDMSLFLCVLCKKYNCIHGDRQNKTLNRKKICTQKLLVVWTEHKGQGGSNLCLLFFCAQLLLWPIFLLYTTYYIPHISSYTGKTIKDFQHCQVMQTYGANAPSIAVSYQIFFPTPPYTCTLGQGCMGF